ncbi:MAG: sigma-70 family RNA polymerase sigma factor [Candidatus Margulisiibacteriota bacterium]
MTQKKHHISNTVIPQSNYRKNTNRDLLSINTEIPAIGKTHPAETEIKDTIKRSLKLVNQVVLKKEEVKTRIESKLINTIFKATKNPAPVSFSDIWKQLERPVLNTIKVFYLSTYIESFLKTFESQVQFLVSKYKRHLPNHISLVEGEDLQTIAQLELIETFKAWNPNKNVDMWPLAYTRINGAMKDHIRYISKADPSRFYDWVIDAASLYLAINDDNSHESKIEDSTELERALKVLNEKEKRIVTLYINEDLTFGHIAKKVNLSESQVSRIYKEATKKIKNTLT